MATRPLVAAFWAIQNCLLTPTFPAVVAADLLPRFPTLVKSKMTQNITTRPGAPHSALHVLHRLFHCVRCMSSSGGANVALPF